MTAGPSLDIVIRSYHRDQRWLAVALRSLARYVSGHREIVVVVPTSTVGRLRTGMVSGPRVRLATCAPERDDYVGQQITKLYADRYSDADLILHLDSDQVFTEACDLRRRLLPDGRPRTGYSSRGRSRLDGWRGGTERFFGQDFPVDLTVSLPVLLPRHVYGGLRRYCLQRHGVPLADHARAMRPDHLCEVGLLRGYVHLHEPDGYAWVDVSDQDLLPELVTFWSRGQSPASVAHLLPAGLAP